MADVSRIKVIQLTQAKHLGLLGLKSPMQPVNTRANWALSAILCGFACAVVPSGWRANHPINSRVVECFNSAVFTRRSWRRWASAILCLSMPNTQVRSAERSANCWAFTNAPSRPPAPHPQPNGHRAVGQPKFQHLLTQVSQSPIIQNPLAQRRSHHQPYKTQPTNEQRPAPLQSNWLDKPSFTILGMSL